ncbi:DUF2726 domain-containing protein [Brucella pseudogrignonensis]|uniref:DUF2726 domain-containing protein n=1 Tax=Brucella pseudogrignonensis TaxID=419475 RepID=UPI0038B57193
MEFLVVLFLFGVFIFYMRRRGRPSNRYGANRQALHSPRTDDRLSALRATTISVKKPINREAYGVLVKIEKVLSSEVPKARVLAEVGMGAFLSTGGGGDLFADDKLAFTSFNAKRVDFLVIDAFGKPAFVVEYQGSGHHLGGSAAERDMLKREAIRRAKIELVEIFDFHSDAEVYALLQGAVQRNFGRFPKPKLECVETS